MIKFRNFKLWLKTIKEGGIRFDALLPSSHYNHLTGKAKVAYPTEQDAKEAACQMSKRHKVRFDCYKCLYCDGWHLRKVYIL